MEGMKTMRARLTFLEPVLGMSPKNEDIYRDFIGSLAPDADSREEEVEALGADAVVEKGMTIFPKLEDGTPFLWDYQLKGFMKDTCGGLRRAEGSKSSKVKAYKKEIDKLIFPQPRKIPFKFDGKITERQRPLRAQTAQGERIGLAISEQIPAGATLEFSVVLLSGGGKKDGKKSDMPTHEELIREWLDYGIYSGIGQWRNSGAGRFVWEELDAEGNVIGGNKAEYMGEKVPA